MKLSGKVFKNISMIFYLKTRCYAVRKTLLFLQEKISNKTPIKTFFFMDIIYYYLLTVYITGKIFKNNKKILINTNFFSFFLKMIISFYFNLP